MKAMVTLTVQKQMKIANIEEPEEVEELTEQLEEEYGFTVNVESIEEDGDDDNEEEDDEEEDDEEEDEPFYTID